MLYFQRRWPPCWRCRRRRTAALSGSPHDFTAKGWSHGALCATCHTPHHPDKTVPNAPRVEPQGHHGHLHPVLQPDAQSHAFAAAHYGSKLCLSCHDGTVALDSFGGTTGTTFMDSANRVGTDLRGTHPIGLIYDTALLNADPKLYNPGTKPRRWAARSTTTCSSGPATWSARPVTTSTIRKTTLRSCASARTEAPGPAGERPLAPADVPSTSLRLHVSRQRVRNPHKPCTHHVGKQSAVRT